LHDIVCNYPPANLHRPFHNHQYLGPGVYGRARATSLQSIFKHYMMDPVWYFDLNIRESPLDMEVGHKMYSQHSIDGHLPAQKSKDSLVRLHIAVIQNPSESNLKITHTDEANAWSRYLVLHA